MPACPRNVPGPETPYVCAGLMVQADDPEQLLTAYTSYSGRMQPLPTWITAGGAVVSMTGGTETISGYYRTLKDNAVPMAALFVQV